MTVRSNPGRAPDHSAARRIDPQRTFKLAAVTLAMATALVAAPEVAAQAPERQLVSFQVEASSLSDALTQIGQQARIQVLFGPGQVAGKSATAVSGSLSVEQALDRVLAGSGLTYARSGAAAFTIVRAAQGGISTLPTVTVAARQDAMPLDLKKATSSGALGRRAQLDTPFSTTVITAEQLEERQVTSITDAFALDPSVTNQASNFTMFASQITTRGLGLDASSGYKINGIPVYAQSLDIPLDQLDSVQLLKGATGFMNGFGAPGGIVNFLTRRPGDEAVRSVDVGYRSKNIWSMHADLGSRFTAQDRFGWRFNATHEEGGNFYPGGKLRRNSFSLGLAARITPDLTANLDLLHSERLVSGEGNAPFMSTYVDSTLPHAPSARKSYIATEGTYHDSRLGFVMAGLEYRVNDGWTLTGKVGRSQVAANYMRDFGSLLNAAGDYEASLLGGGTKLVYGTAQLLLEGRFKTGALGHHLTLGAERQALDVDGSRRTYPWSDNGIGNIYVPFANVYSGGRLDLGGWYRANEYSRSDLFVSDTLTLGHWSIIAGIRHNDYKQQSFSQATGAVVSEYKKDGNLTPTLAVLYKPVSNTTLYASYVESLESGGVVGSTYANANEILKPLKSKQYEVGTKAEGANWSASAALFRVERAAAYANALNYYVQEGLTVYQGAELNANVKPTRAWTVGGGLMLLEAKYRKGTAYDNDRVAGTPRLSATAYARYDIAELPGLALHGNVKYVGDSYVRPGRPVPTSSRTIVGVGAAYQTRAAGYPIALRAEISNLFDRRGWVSAGSQVYLLNPRMVALNAKVEF